jgi:hypothetical protein
MASTKTAAPRIFADLWEGDREIVEKVYWTVCVYKHNGLGQEATEQNVYATSQEDACQVVASSKPWLRLNPMYAFKQESRIF